ncbi:hypothetical protein ABIE69_002359 [Rhodobacteraceae bacterium MBR-64]|jgi:hypothetical protein
MSAGGGPGKGAFRPLCAFGAFTPESIFAKGMNMSGVS